MLSNAALDSNLALIKKRSTTQKSFYKLQPKRLKMNSRTMLVCVLLMCAAATAKAGPRDYFMFPDAVITTGGALIEGRFKPSENWSVEKKEGATHAFRGGNRGASGVEFWWEFVLRTEHGDVYLLVFTHDDHETKKIPLLFDGQETLTLSVFGGTFSIQNK